MKNKNETDNAARNTRGVVVSKSLANTVQNVNKPLDLIQTLSPPFNRSVPSSTRIGPTDADTSRGHNQPLKKGAPTNKETTRIQKIHGNNVEKTKTKAPADIRRRLATHRATEIK